MISIIYIYIYRERERDICIYIYIYTHVFTHVYYHYMDTNNNNTCEHVYICRDNIDHGQLRITMTITMIVIMVEMISITHNCQYMDNNDSNNCRDDIDHA